LPRLLKGEACHPFCHGLRFKITRIDLKGNIRAVLSHGSSNQEILIVTKASSREEGERIAKEIMELLV
ncbi:MAG: DUF2103 domain-containing protein, partial [Archaeoglobus sp.]|nr:DUF2103 domain-containing protein [Archaeoglobus sp.]